MKLQRYSRYKDSGVPWLGEVPEHWEPRKLRHLLRPIAIRNRPDLPLLSVVREKGVILRDVTNQDENHNFIPDDLTNYKAVRAGQFAMNKMKAWQGSYGVSSFDGIVSPAYFVFDLSGVSGKYFHTAIRSRAYVPFFTRASDGVRIAQWDLSQARMREIPFFVPPLPEQAAIVRFLDHEDRRIRRYIRAKQKLIKLLEEQKQAIIHRAVTRGLDPNVRLKPSGVQWLGDVPEHWEVRRIQGVFRERKETGQPEWPILIVSIARGVTKGDEFDEDGRPKRLIEDKGLYKVAHKGDIAYNMMRMWQGAVGVVPENGLVSPAYVVAQPQVQMNSEYFALLFRTEACKGDTVSRSRGIVDDRNRLYWDGFKDLRVPVPPYNEQSVIVTSVTSQTRAINKSIERVNHEVSLVREYRTRLIADVVTGKLDVRAAAARLPDEIEEPELLEETEADANVDADAAEDIDATSEEAGA